jgi:putative nucleotidyltransferase with HDIG domain
MALIFGGITLGVMAIGWLVARHLTSPLTRLVAAAELVSGGDLSARSNVRTSDEIGVLGTRFDAMAEKLELQHIATIGALASAIDARDPYTAGHSLRVGDLSAELGGAIGLPKPALHHLRVGGLLHDIGKIGVPDTVLLKPGSLTDEERRLIEQHPTIGLRILESAQLPREVLQIVGGHHERLNGGGYPLGLSAEEISVFPRIAAVADVYDALTTDRPYRRGYPPQDALRILFLEAESGLLDPEIVAAMRRIASIWEERRATTSVVTKAWVESLQVIKEVNHDAA